MKGKEAKHDMGKRGESWEGGISGKVKDLTISILSTALFCMELMDFHERVYELLPVMTPIKQHCGCGGGSVILVS